MDVFWDLETFGPNAVKPDRCKVACGAALIDGKEVRLFLGDRLGDLRELLHKADTVVGFNQQRFDNLILGRLTETWPPDDWDGTEVDLLACIWRSIGGRRKGFTLGQLAFATLSLEGRGKGSQMPQLFEQHRLDEVFEHCVQDVRLTAELFYFIRRRGYVIDPMRGVAINVRIED